MRWKLLLLALVVARPGWGAPLDPGSLDVRSAGMGGATRSLAETIAAARMNPAALNLRRGFFGGAGYATQKSPQLDAVQLTLVDAITSPMGGAIQYLRLEGAGEREDVALSLAAGGRGLWWGFTARYVHVLDAGDTEWEDAISGDVGVLIQRPGGIRIGIVGYDLLETPSESMARRVAIGVSRSGRNGLTLAADAVRNLERDFDGGVDLHLGVEYRAGSALALRAGQFWSGETGEDCASAGVGWEKNTWRVGYAVRKTRQEPAGFLHLLELEASF